MIERAQLRETVDSLMPDLIADLTRLVAIPSLSSQPQHAADVRAAAELVAGQLTDLGADDVSIVAAGGQPAIIAHFLADESQPTVCLYAHLDVQPTGDLSRWSSEPFAAQRRGDRLYGRGTADDKGGVICHLGALRAWDGKPPVNVTVLIEGEEETGSPTLAAILDQHRAELAADLYVIADCENWRAGEPAFTTSLRGVVDCVVEVTTATTPVHSGQFGGLVPDALTTLCRLLGTLHDAEGNVAVTGLVSEYGPDLPPDEEGLRSKTGLVDGVRFIGSGPLASRNWYQPAISVIGLDTTPIASSSNVIIPSAKARISLRVAPGDTTNNAWARLVEHLQTHVSWGAQVSVFGAEKAEPCRNPLSEELAAKAERVFTEAYGLAPVAMGMGGTIGMIAEFQQAFPDADVLCTAVADPDCRMHGIDESLYLPDLRAACLAEALLLAEVAR